MPDLVCHAVSAVDDDRLRHMDIVAVTPENRDAARSLGALSQQRAGRWLLDVATKPIPPSVQLAPSSVE